MAPTTNRPTLLRRPNPTAAGTPRKAPVEGAAGGDPGQAKRRTAVRTLHLDAAPQDLPIAVQSVPIEVIQDQGLVRLGAAVRDVSGVTRKEAYFGLTDSFNIRGFDASTGLFNGFRHDDVDPWKPALDLVRNGGARIGACRH